jgi:hydrogenase maturation protein HypF
LEIEFEAEAAMRLETAVAEEKKESYDFSVREDIFPLQISFAKTIKAVLKDIKQKASVRYISAKFHNTLAQVIVHISERARKEYGISTVVLIGGVFLNKRLLSRASLHLEKKGFKVLRPINYSPNDESISIGQIAFALAKLKST